MKKKWLIIFGILIKISAGEVDNEYHRSDPLNSDDTLRVKRQVNSIPELSDQTSTLDTLRSKRQATSIPDLLDRTSTLARISNGISLQAGLLNGSMPIDDVFRELLSLGSLKLSDIESMDLKAIGDLASILKDLPNSLKANAETSYIEDQTIKWKKVLVNALEIGDFENLPGSDDYFTIVKNSETFFKANSFSNIFLPFGSFRDDFQKFMEVDDTTTDDEATKDFNIFWQTQPVAKIKLEGFKLLPFSNFSALQNYDSIFGPVPKMINVMKLRSLLKEKGSTLVVSDIDNFVSNVSAANDKSSEARNDVSKLSDLISSRIRPYLTPRSFTSGFQHGPSEISKLSGDVLKAWFVKLVGGKTEKLADALKPIISSMKKADSVSTQLASISNSEIAASFQRLSELQDIIQKFPFNPTAAISSVPANLNLCFAKNQAASDNWFTKVNEFLESSSKLAENMKILLSLQSPSEESLAISDFDDLKTTISGLIKNTSDPTRDEILAASGQLKSSGKAKAFGDKLEAFTNNLKNISGTNFVELVGKVIQGQAELTTFQNDARTRSELEVHQCLKNMATEIDEATLAIEVFQKLRSLDDKPVTDVETSASTLLQVSAGFKDLRTISNEIKKTKQNETIELSKMKNSLTTSQVIGVTNEALQNAVKLVELRDDVDSLEKTDIQKEIDTVVDPTKKAAIQQSLGSLKTDIVILKDGLGKASDYLNGSTAKTRKRRFAEALNKLAEIPSIPFDAIGKSKALGDLLQTMQSPSSELLAAKKTLDALSQIDLDFAKHKTSITSAPKAIKDLQDFFESFFASATASVTVPPGKQSPGNETLSEATPAMDSDDVAAEKDEGSNLILIIVIVAVAVFLILIIVVLIVCWKKGWFQKKKKADPSKLIAWINKQKFKLPKDAYRCHEVFMKYLIFECPAGDKESSFGYLPLKKHRADNRFCNPETALTHLTKKGEPMPIHANYVTTQNGKKFIAAQGPLDVDQLHDDTREDYWHMIMTEETEFVVMLCKFVEKGEKKCAEYFSEAADGKAVCGRYEVTTQSVAKSINGVANEDVVERAIQITDTTGELDARTIKHLHYTNWEDQKVPKERGHENIYAMLKYMESSKKPIVVHCSSGVGRTMVFIGIAAITEAVEANPETRMLEEMVKLRSQRYDAIQTIRQSHFLQLGVVYKLSMDHNLDMKMYKEQYEMFYEMAFKDALPESVRAARKEIKDQRAKARAANMAFDGTQQASNELAKVVLY